MTERDMLDLLLQRYTDVRLGSIADRWIRAEFVASTLLWRNRKRIVDFVAADKYPGDSFGSKLALHGHEIKVARGDWLSELADPSKAEAGRRYMHHWWLVVPDTSVAKVSELPDGWGMMAISKGKLRVRKAAPRLDPPVPPLEFTLALTSAAVRTAYRDPLRRDAPVAFIRQWTNRLCGFCGAQSPCQYHQPRMIEAQRQEVADDDHQSSCTRS